MGLKKITIEEELRNKWKLKRFHGDITAIYNHYKDSGFPIGRSAIKEAFGNNKANPSVIQKINQYYEKAI